MFRSPANAFRSDGEFGSLFGRTLLPSDQLGAFSRHDEEVHTLGECLKRLTMPWPRFGG